MPCLDREAVLVARDAQLAGVAVPPELELDVARLKALRGDGDVDGYGYGAGVGRCPYIWEAR